MIKKYEKLEIKEVLGVSETSYKIVDKAEATHEHICFHDEAKPKPCVRKALK